jgi:hypothetical protein
LWRDADLSPTAKAGVEPESSANAAVLGHLDDDDAGPGANVKGYRLKIWLVPFAPEYREIPRYHVAGRT